MCRTENYILSSNPRIVSLGALKPRCWNYFLGITHKKTVHPFAEGKDLEAFNIISNKVYVKMFISKEDGFNWSSFHFEGTILTKLGKEFP